MIAVPFVFRLSRELQAFDASALNKKLGRKLKDALKRQPLLWTTREHDERYSNFEITHLNGEILIFPEELETVRKAFRTIYGYQNKGINSSIRFPLTSRNKQIQRHGEFYAIYNWVGYATKQEHQRDRNHRKNAVVGIATQIDINRYHYISGALNARAKAFYITCIKKSKHLLN